MKILIAETTKAERQKIVDEAIGNINGLCDGCACGVIRMYDDYIEGRKELSQINQAFVKERSR